MTESELARATSTVVGVKAAPGRSLSPDEIREAFTRQPGIDIIDYEVVTRGFWPVRVKEIKIIVAASVDNAGPVG